MARKAVAESNCFHLHPVRLGHRRFLNITQGADGKTYELRLYRGRYTEVAVLQHGLCLYFYYNANWRGPSGTVSDEDSWVGPLDP